MNRRWWIALLVLWSWLILLATLIPDRQLSNLPDVSLWMGADLWVHALLFFGFGFIATSVSPDSESRKIHHKSFLKILLTGIVFGGITELLQAVLPIQRDASWFDFLADIAGLSFGIIVRSLPYTDRKFRHLKLS